MIFGGIISRCLYKATKSRIKLSYSILRPMNNLKIMNELQIYPCVAVPVDSHLDRR